MESLEQKKKKKKQENPNLNQVYHDSLLEFFV